MKMAKRVVEILTDDLDGGEATETVSFALDGKAYEIDLGEENAAKLRGALEPFVAKARKARKSRSGSGPVRTPEETEAIRVWARGNGFEVADRGRLSLKVVSAYEDAMREAATKG